jgi:hypothetical protein
MLRSSAVRIATTFLCALPLGIAGCGGEDAAHAPTSSISSGQESAGKLAPQAAVVQKFLDAIQKGDRESAKTLLTAKANSTIQEHKVSFLPEGKIAGGSFRIGKPVQSGKIYFVPCVYSIQEAGGQTVSENLQWMIKEDEGTRWAIFGMAIHTPNKKPLVVNFETKDLIATEESSQSQQASQPAIAPATQPQQAAAQDPFQVTPR